MNTNDLWVDPTLLAQCARKSSSNKNIGTFLGIRKGKENCEHKLLLQGTRTWNPLGPRGRLLFSRQYGNKRLRVLEPTLCQYLEL